MSVVRVSMDAGQVEEVEVFDFLAFAHEDGMVSTVQLAVRFNGDLLLLRKFSKEAAAQTGASHFVSAFNYFYPDDV